jgi:5'-deoxynucleotidase YfbR-like HD superfamily hydrolase
MLRDPDCTPIALGTIAKALGHVARFGGHTKRFYSVAEHCLHVSLLLQDTHGVDGARYGLMHDAHEAYVGDIPTPIKAMLGVRWARLEAAWEARIALRFALAPPDPVMAAAIKRADRIALATEMRCLMSIDDSRDIEGVDPDPEWDCLGGTDAGEAFYARAVQLGWEG